ncbi:MAG: hypothetical protein JSR73_12115 [Proteobacteria bacterium]|nr:hypothetical protein [Pseudomonadota bacterium]
MDYVVALGEKAGEGQSNWFGSATLYAEVVGYSEDKEHCRWIPWLITCRHNFLGEDRQPAKEILMRLNLKSGEPKDFTLPLSEGGRLFWAGHPNPDVDIAAFCLGGDQIREKEVSEKFLRSDLAWTVAQMREAGVSEGDGAFVLGYPLGEMSRGRQRPVCRSGCFARIQDCYDDPSQPYLVDAQVFPGNSGGLVVTCPDGTALKGTKTIERAMPVGIVCGVQSHWSHVRVDGDERRKVRVKDPAGLGVVQPMDRIPETLAHHRATVGAGSEGKFGKAPPAE